ncbi:hypothetical protein [Nonomuraea dietziae]|uniref:hypothetical protein n=1 Tax=Nonomuraea dietziae TaxID=65515 RepID=UPI0031D4839C
MTVPALTTTATLQVPPTKPASVTGAIGAGHARRPEGRQPRAGGGTPVQQLHPREAGERGGHGRTVTLNGVDKAAYEAEFAAAPEPRPTPTTPATPAPASSTASPPPRATP